eukprot:4563336-Pyramimonas_sp.AAC.1
MDSSCCGCGMTVLTLQPQAPSSLAMEAPIPRDAPVTTHTGRSATALESEIESITTLVQSR